MMRSTKAQAEQTRTREAELDVRYGKIGISAVAAALRYQSDGKNPAYAPSETNDLERAHDAT
jgi:hypothetical protein